MFTGLAETRTGRGFQAIWQIMQCFASKAVDFVCKCDMQGYGLTGFA